MFGKVDAKKKNTFLEQTKLAREERAHERKREEAAIVIQVCMYVVCLSYLED